MNELVITGDVNIVSNFEALKNGLQINIKEKYSLAVTEDSVKDAKSVMAQINKDKKEIADKWKLKKSELEKPIKEMDLKIKELLALFDDARNAISLQVDNFEAGRRELAVKLCKEYASEILTKKNLSESGFNLEQLNDFNNLTYVSEKGALTSVAKQAVENKVSEFELEILRKKQEEAERIIREEKIKQEAIERFKQEQELQRQAQANTQEQAPVSQVQEQPKEEQEQPKEPVISDDGKRTYEITLTLKIDTAKDESFVLEFLRKRIDSSLWERMDKKIR